MLNRVVEVGRLTKDPELRTTQGGKISIVSFTLAVDRNFKNANGEYDADFLRCVAWRKTAELIDARCSRGDLISVDGELRSRSYEDKDGKRVYVTEINVDNVGFLTSKREHQANQQAVNNPAQPMTSNIPPAQQAQPQPQDPFAKNSGTVDISDKDLPF